MDKKETILQTFGSGGAPQSYPDARLSFFNMTSSDTKLKPNNFSFTMTLLPGTGK